VGATLHTTVSSSKKDHRGPDGAVSLRLWGDVDL
jgi:hypothetical protein